MQCIKNLNVLHNAHVYLEMCIHVHVYMQVYISIFIHVHIPVHYGSTCTGVAWCVLSKDGIQICFFIIHSCINDALFRHNYTMKQNAHMLNHVAR